MTPDAAVAEVAGWGPFFAAELHGPDAPPGPPWRPLRELADDPGVLRDRVAGVRAYLATANGRERADVPVRVAASVTQMGLAARLTSPVMAVALLTGEVLAPVWWQPELGGAFPLALTPYADDTDDTDDGAAGALRRRILNGPVRDLVAASRPYSVSSRVLWGNVASAVNGAATMIARARADLAGPADDLARRLLAEPPLRGTGDRRDGAFRRRSCCLIYRAAHRGAPRAVCGDCVLATPTPPEGAQP